VFALPARETLAGPASSARANVAELGNGRAFGWEEGRTRKGSEGSIQEDFMTDATSAARAVGMGIAGGAAVTALIDLLIAKGVIDREEARGVLESAMYRAAMYTGTLEGHEATKIIGKWLEEEIAANDGSQ
jgi:polyhydroxyalkanoate synthesis regulator phasin